MYGPHVYLFILIKCPILLKMVEKEPDAEMALNYENVGEVTLEFCAHKGFSSIHAVSPFFAFPLYNVAKTCRYHRLSGYLSNLPK